MHGIRRFSSVIQGPVPERCDNSIPGINVLFPGVFILAME